jgi:hypothetical protein
MGVRLRRPSQRADDCKSILHLCWKELNMPGNGGEIKHTERWLTYVAFAGVSPRLARRRGHVIGRVRQQRQSTLVGSGVGANHCAYEAACYVGAQCGAVLVLFQWLPTGGAWVEVERVVADAG